MRISRLVAFLIFSLLIAGVAAADQSGLKTYKVDTAASLIKWEGNKVGGAHDGEVRLKSGTVSFDAQGKLVGGEFEIDFTSIKNYDLKDPGYRAKLEGHLKADDFFNVAQFPVGTFTLVKAALVQDSGATTDYKLDGVLSVKGISNPVRFPAKIMKHGDLYHATAELEIDRVRWKIEYNSGSVFDVKALGDKLIKDEVKIGLDLKTVAE